MFHSYGFDVSVFEMWGALLNGGRVTVVPYWVSRSPDEFYDFLAAERVTVLSQTPSAFSQLILAAEIRDADPSELSLRYVIFAGERLDAAALRPWLDRFGDEAPAMVNMYGITEVTVHATFGPVRAEDAVGGESAIGSPLGDLDLVLLDGDLARVPVGEVGEIYVAGPGLARGYFGDPARTADRFVPNPFPDVPGARLYRSGDLAVRSPDGRLVYRGRIDDQIKLRGFRIELGRSSSGSWPTRASPRQPPGASNRPMTSGWSPSSSPRPGTLSTTRNCAPSSPSTCRPTWFPAPSGLCVGYH